MARARLLVAATVLSLVLAGCSGGPGGSKPPLEASAAPATLEAGTVSDLELEQVEARDSWVNTTLFVSIQGDVELSASREVHARTHVVTYRKQGSSPPVLVAVYSAPAVTLLPDTAPTVRNPTGSWNRSRLVGAAQSTYSVESLSVDGERQGPFLGNQTTINSVSGTATYDGESHEVTGTIATTRHEGEFLTVVAIGPSGADLPETETVLSGVAHAEK